MMAGGAARVGSRPVWSPRTLGEAGALTLLLFGVLPLAHVLNRPDVEQLIALRDVSAVALPPPPTWPMIEPEPVVEPVVEPVTVDLPVPSPTLPTPSPTPLAWDLTPSLLAGGWGAGLGGLDWEVEGAVFSLADIDTPPRPVAQIPPMYPPSARLAGQEGEVELAFVVTSEGMVTGVEVVSSRPGTVFVNAARSAVERWRFEPALRRGEPVSVRVQVPLKFSLEQR